MRKLSCFILRYVAICFQGFYVIGLLLLRLKFRSMVCRGVLWTKLSNQKSLLVICHQLNNLLHHGAPCCFLLVYVHELNWSESNFKLMPFVTLLTKWINQKQREFFSALWSFWIFNPVEFLLWHKWISLHGADI